MWSVRARLLDHCIAARLHSSITSYSNPTPSGSFAPFVGKFCRREHLEVVDVANLLAGVDIDANGCHWPPADKDVVILALRETASGRARCVGGGREPSLPSRCARVLRRCR